MCVVKFSVTAIFVHYSVDSGVTVDNLACVDIAVFSQNDRHNSILKFGTTYAQRAVWCELLIAPLNKKYIRRELLVSHQFLRLYSVHSVYVTLKDRKRTLSGKNDHNALWHERNSYNAKLYVVAVFK